MKKICQFCGDSFLPDEEPYVILLRSYRSGEVMYCGNPYKPVYSCKVCYYSRILNEIRFYPKSQPNG